MACVLFLVAVGMYVGAMHFWDLEVKNLKREAIKIGAAEWRTDENGETTFHWKPREQP